MPGRRLAVMLALAAAAVAAGVWWLRPAAEPAAGEAVVRTCNICGAEAVFDRHRGRPEAGCPRCKSKERHRLLMYFLEHETSLFRDRLDVLHFSPMPGEKERLRRLPNLNYRTASIEAEAEDLWADLTALVFMDDASWDVLIVYHVLEHIADDRKAMAEMYRVLRPGGRVYLQVPLERGRTETYEDPAIVDAKQRALHFGQWDHVRIYGTRGLRERLEAAGFTVEVVDYLARLDPAVIERHGLATRGDPSVDETIWIASKP